MIEMKYRAKLCVRWFIWHGARDIDRVQLDHGTRRGSWGGCANSPRLLTTLTSFFGSLFFYSTNTAAGGPGYAELTRRAEFRPDCVERLATPRISLLRNWILVIEGLRSAVSCKRYHSVCCIDVRSGGQIVNCFRFTSGACGGWVARFGMSSVCTANRGITTGVERRPRQPEGNPMLSWTGRLQFVCWLPWGSRWLPLNNTSGEG